jgi:hypothetical protein
MNGVSELRRKMRPKHNQPKIHIRAIRQRP